MRTFAIIQSLIVILVLAASTSAASPEQQALQKAKDLYAQAAYEDALGVLSNLPSNETTTEAHRYRASCLLALGRVEEASQVLSEVVRTDPEYMPDPSETSPRVMELFKAARRARLPEVLRATYAEGKAAMDRQDLEAAVQRFELVGRVAATADLAGDTTVVDLKVLAEGFLDLARARLAAARPAAGPPEAMPAADAGRASADPPGTQASAPAGNASRVITPAVAIDQQLPSWIAPSGLSRSWEFAGAVRVEIGAHGKVTSAAIEEPVHPTYDGRLLAAAKDWTYRPALLNGVPVASSLTVRVVLKPR